MTTLELFENESQASLMSRITNWVSDNKTDLVKLSNNYRNYAPCDSDDFLSQAVIAAHDAAQVAMRKQDTVRFRSYFNRIFTSQCYQFTHRKIFSRTDVGPVVIETTSATRSSLEWGPDDNAPSHHPVDERTPQSLALSVERERLLDAIFVNCRELALGVMKAKERQVWELILSGENDIEGILDISRQRIQKLRDSGLERVTDLFAGVVKRSLVDGRVSYDAFLENVKVFAARV